MKWLVTLAALLVAGPISASSDGASGISRSCGTAPPYRPGRLGALAFWHSGSLRVLDVSSGKARVAYTPPSRTMAGTPLAWSPDGRWIAFGADVIPAAGGTVCQPFGPGASDLGWVPAGGRLAGKSRVGAVVLGPLGDRPQVVLKSRFTEQSFDPTGTRLAVSILYVEHPNRSSSQASVYVVDVRTGKRRGPLAELNIGLGYYGLHDWASLLPWYQP